MTRKFSTGETARENASASDPYDAIDLCHLGRDSDGHALDHGRGHALFLYPGVLQDSGSQRNDVPAVA